MFTDNVEDQAVKLHAIASLKVVVNAENHNNLETIDHNHPTTNGHQPSSNGHASIMSINTERHASQETTITTVSNSIDAGATSNSSQDGMMSHSITLGNGTAAGTSAMVNGGEKAPHNGVTQEQDKQVLRQSGRKCCSTIWVFCTFGGTIFYSGGIWFYPAYLEH